jgi:predicted transport protein
MVHLMKLTVCRLPTNIQIVPGGNIIVSVILSKKMCMCPNPNGFRNGAISLCSSKIVDKKGILRSVSNTGIYCSSDKVSTVYVVR